MPFRKCMVLHLTRPLLSCKGILLNVGENVFRQDASEIKSEIEIQNLRVISE